MRRNLVEKKLDELFDVRSGDFHATKELDPGRTPLVSCGDTTNGLVGYFNIPAEKIYKRSITVAYNGQPLTAKFHSYRFGAKDDVAVLIPRNPMKDTTLLYVAALLNRMTWRYSYNRKCFREKLRAVSISVPVTKRNGKQIIDEKTISQLFPSDFRSFIPRRSNTGPIKVPRLRWRTFTMLEIFDIERGDFHSIDDLDPGGYITVSRVSDDNGVVGYFDRPENAKVYERGQITVSTVGGDAFVQLDEFIATDNVIICTPKKQLRTTTLFFLVFMLNRQKWRYSYGRQCYRTKLERARFYLPVTPNDDLDEESIRRIVEQTSYWPKVRRCFDGTRRSRK